MEGIKHNIGSRISFDELSLYKYPCRIFLHKGFAVHRQTDGRYLLPFVPGRFLIGPGDVLVIDENGNQSIENVK